MNKAGKGILFATVVVGMFGIGLISGKLIWDKPAEKIIVDKGTEDMTIQEMMSAMYRENPDEAIEYAHNADGQPGIINSDYEAYLNTIVKMEQMRAALNMGASFKEIGITWD